jgi:hypothetical protein
VPQYPNHKVVSSPRLIKSSVQISCAGLSCVLRIKGFGADSSVAFVLVLMSEVRSAKEDRRVPI